MSKMMLVAAMKLLLARVISFPLSLRAQGTLVIDNSNRYCAKESVIDMK